MSVPGSDYTSIITYFDANRFFVLNVIRLCRVDSSVVKIWMSLFFNQRHLVYVIFIIFFLFYFMEKYPFV